MRRTLSIAFVIMGLAGAAFAQSDELAQSDEFAPASNRHGREER